MGYRPRARQPKPGPIPYRRPPRGGMPITDLASLNAARNRFAGELTDYMTTPIEDRRPPSEAQQFVDWGSSESPDDRARADRAAARLAARGTYVERRPHLAWLIRHWRWFAGLFAVAFVVSYWQIVLPVAVLVLAVAVPIGRRRHRHQLHAELAARADQALLDWYQTNDPTPPTEGSDHE